MMPDISKVMGKQTLGWSKELCEAPLKPCEPEIPLLGLKELFVHVHKDVCRGMLTDMVYNG